MLQLLSTIFSFVTGFFKNSDKEDKKEEKTDAREKVTGKRKERNIVTSPHGYSIIKGTNYVIGKQYRTVIGKEENGKIVSLSNPDIILLCKKKFACVKKKEENGKIVTVPLSNYDISHLM
jgi:hypothetical protein